MQFSSRLLLELNQFCLKSEEKILCRNFPDIPENLTKCRKLNQTAKKTRIIPNLKIELDLSQMKFDS